MSVEADDGTDEVAPNRLRRLAGGRGGFAGAATKARDVATAMIVEIVQVASMAIIFPIVARSFGPADYGRYSTLYVISGFAMVWTAGAVGAGVIQLSLQHQRSPSSLLRAARRQVWWTTVPAALIGCAAAVALFGTDILLPAVIVFGGDLLIGGLASVQVAVVFAERGVAPATRIRVIAPALKAILVVGLALADQVTIVSVILASSIAGLAMFLASVVAVRSMETSTDRPAADGREVLRYSMLYATTISANVVQDGGENVVLAATRPIAETGEYQAAYRLAELALMPVRALGTVSIRWFLVPDGRRGAQVTRSARLSALVVVYGLVCVAAFVLLAPFVTIVIGDDFEVAVEIMIWLSGFPLARALSDIPVLGLLGLDRNTVRMWLSLAGAAFALACYLVLVPAFGWRGAVVGTYLSEGASLIGGWVLLLHHQRRHDEARAGSADDRGGEPSRETH